MGDVVLRRSPYTVHGDLTIDLSTIATMLGTSPRAREPGADRGVLDVAREAAWQERHAPIYHARAQLRTRLVLVFCTRVVVSMDTGFPQFSWRKPAAHEPVA